MFTPKKHPPTPQIAPPGDVDADVHALIVGTEDNERVRAVAEISVARRQLADAVAIGDIGAVARIIDSAEFVRSAARRARLGEDAQREWARLSLEAQRDAGRLLATMPLSTGGRPRETGASVAPVPTLQELLGTETRDEAKHRAQRWQQVAAVPDELFEAYIAKAEEPTRSRVLQLARTDAARRRNDQMPDGVFNDVEIRLGDFRTVLADLDDTVDAIICDPPYPKEFVPLLGDLADLADRLLKPDGVLVVMYGHTWLPDAYELLGRGRPYRWTGCFLMPGQNAVVHPRRVATGWKPLLVYGAGPRFYDVVESVGGRDDGLHKWGQQVTGMSTIVERLSRPGDLVVDPFLGGGTTAVAARNLGRRFIGCDIDPVAVETTQRRLEDSEWRVRA